MGVWADSPLGSFADVMTEAADGVRTLLAPTAAVRDYVAATYHFDETIVVPVTVERDTADLRVDAGPLHATVAIGARTPVGRALRVLPGTVARSTAWASLIDPVARVVMRGVRTRGRAAPDRREWYGAVDVHGLRACAGEWDGHDVGAIADVWPPVRFGFGSTPRVPAIVDLTTTVEAPERSLTSPGCRDRP